MARPISTRTASQDGSILWGNHELTVIGAGIGGLSAALSLHAAGIDVRVYESVADMKAIGFGINLQPNAVRELIELGLGDALAETAIETAELRYYNKLGQLIWSEPRGRAAGYAWPQYAIERGDLADDPARRGQGEDRRGERIDRPSPRLVRAGRLGRDRAFYRTGKRTAASAGAQRRVGRLRRHSIPPCGRSSIREKGRR